MALTEQDRIDITDLINLHGHLTDAGQLDQWDALFTPDITYDVADFGLGSLQGNAAMRAAARHRRGQPGRPSRHQHRDHWDRRSLGSGPCQGERYRRASIAQSADEMRQLYAADAVHEFPFTHPGLPARLEGRDEIVDWITAGWRANRLRYERFRTLAVHHTSAADTIIVEQEALGTSAATGEFALPNLVVLTTRRGQIARLRDYVNIPAATAAIGSDG